MAGDFMVITLSVYLLRGIISISASLFKRGWAFCCAFPSFLLPMDNGDSFYGMSGSGIGLFLNFYGAKLQYFIYEDDIICMMLL